MSIYFKINQIKFDFTDDALDSESQDEIYDEVLNTIWSVDNEEELVDAISDYTGWCVSFIDYSPVGWCVSSIDYSPVRQFTSN